MRYERFDDGLSAEDDPWTEKESELKAQLWQDAKVVEDFEDGDMPKALRELSAHPAKEVEEGVLNIERVDRDGLFRIGDNDSRFESVTMCVKSSGDLYFSCHTGALEEYQNDIEPTIFLNQDSTWVTGYYQEGDEWNSRNFSHDEFGYIDDWTVVEIRHSEDGLIFFVNGKRKATVGIDGRPFPGVWFHLLEGTESAQIDYIILK